MSKKLPCLLMGAMLLCTAGISGAGSVKTYQTDASVAPGDAALISTDYNSPLVTLRADPFLYKDKDTGKYYFTGSYPTYDRIELTCADSVNGISAAVPKTIWVQPSVNYTSYVWAPEIHKVKDKWVIFFTLSDGGEWNIKCCVLFCKGDDPMTDDWEWGGYMQSVASDEFSFRWFSLDMTTFENNGRWYVIWAQTDGGSNLYLAELDADHPNKLLSEPMLLTKPEYDWEKDRETVNEGPGVFKHAGKIYVTFSGAATGYEYCMGLLEIDDDKDPLIKSNWKKYDKPVFSTDPLQKIYGPGHNNFVEGDHGELLCVLHFRSYRDIIGGNGNSLYDYNRQAHVMKMSFGEDGMPQFAFDPEDLYNVDFNNHGA